MIRRKQMSPDHTILTLGDFEFAVPHYADVFMIGVTVLKGHYVGSDQMRVRMWGREEIRQFDKRYQRAQRWAWLPTRPFGDPERMYRSRIVVDSGAFIGDESAIVYANDGHTHLSVNHCRFAENQGVIIKQKEIES